MSAMKDLATELGIDYSVPDEEMHDPECTGCEHDCPWRRSYRRGGTLGAPFCGVCDDHGEAVHAGYGDVPCDCGDEH